MPSEPPTSSLPDEIDIGQGLRRLRRRLPILIVSVAVGALLGWVYTTLVRPIYQARVTIFFPVKAPSLLGVGGLTEGLGTSSAAALLGGGVTPMKIFRSFLESERTLDVVSAGSNLSRRDVDDMRRFDEQTAANTLTVFVTDHDAALAKKVVELHVEALTQINSDLSIATLVDDARVLKQKLNVERSRLSAAEDRLLAFRRKALTAPVTITSQGGGSASLTTWSQQLRQLEVKRDGINATLATQRKRASAMAQASPRLPSDLPPARIYRPQLIEAQYDLALKEKTLGPDDPGVIDLKNRITLLRSKLKTEIAAYLKAVSKSIVEPGNNSIPTEKGTEIANLATKVDLDAQIAALTRLAALAPKESDTLTRLTFEASIETASVETLAAQAKIAEIQAARDPNRWTLLDPPRIDDKPVNKKFSRNIALAAIAGLFVGIWLSVRPIASKS